MKYVQSEEFEYRFNILHVVDQAGQQFPNPVDWRDIETFQTLAGGGWEIVAMSPNPLYGDQLVVALKRKRSTFLG